MKTWIGIRRNGANRFLGLVLISLMFATIIFTSMGLLLNSAVLADEPLQLNYRTISAVDQSNLPGTTVWTMQLIVTNSGTITYHNVTVTAGSLTDPTANYGSVLVGDVPVGGSQTINGAFQVPDVSFGDMTFRLDHS